MANELGSILSILSIEFTSVTRGYRALDLVTRCDGVKVIDASPSGGGQFLILLSGRSDALEACLEAVKKSVTSNSSQLFDHIFDVELLSTLTLKSEAIESAVQALYSLPQVQAEEALLVFECASISTTLLAAAKMVHSHQLKCVEIKIQRSRGGAYAFLTGPSSSCSLAAETARALFHGKSKEGQVDVINKPVAAFREFFNLSGQA